MPILSRDELQRRLSSVDVEQLADLTQDGAETAGAVAAALADAENEVIGYVRAVTRAPVPDPAPELLKRCVTDIARYNLYQRHVSEDHPVYVAYVRTIATLRDIAAGRIALDFGGEAPTGTSVAWAPERYMTDAALARMLPR